MDTFAIDRGTIVFQLYGRGPLVVWNAGGREPGLGGNEPLVELLTGRCAILLWDRRNCAGSSSIDLSDADSPTHADADDLHALLRHLNLGPACIGGGSAGCALSVLMAHRYPQDVVSVLAFKAAAMSETVMRLMAEMTWIRLAEAAEKAGMQAVADLSDDAHRKLQAGTGEFADRATGWIARSIAANPANRDRLLAMDASRFAETFRRWGDHTRFGGGFAGLTSEAIGAIELPVFISAGDDPIHPPESADWLAQHLPAAQMAAGLDNAGEITTADAWWAALWPELDDFIRRTLSC